MTRIISVLLNTELPVSLCVCSVHVFMIFLVFCVILMEISSSDVPNGAENGSHAHWILESASPWCLIGVAAKMRNG